MYFFRKATTSILCLFAFFTFFALTGAAQAQPTLTVDTVYDPMSPLPAAVSFSAVASFYAHSWLWDFGDGQTSTQAAPRHIYAQGGEIEVSVTAQGHFGQTASATTTIYLDNVIAEDHFDSLSYSESVWPDADFSQILVIGDNGDGALALELSDGEGNQTAADTGVTMDQNGNGTQQGLPHKYFYRFDLDLNRALLAVGDLPVSVFHLQGIDVSVDVRRYAGTLQMRTSGPGGSTAWLSIGTSSEVGALRIEYRPDDVYFEVEWTSLETANEEVLSILYPHVPVDAAWGAFIGISADLMEIVPDYGTFTLDNVGIYRHAFPSQSSVLPGKP